MRQIWQTSGDPGLGTEIMVPKGTVEIIFDFSEVRFVNAMFLDKYCHLPKCFINGFNDIPIRVQWPSPHHFMGIEFHPLAIKKILRIPPAQFANCAVDMTLVHRQFSDLWQHLSEQKTFEARVSVVLRWVESHMVQLHPQEKLLNDTICQIRPAHLTIPELASALHYSPRHLSRKIQEITGMNSEEFLQYQKFFYAVHLLHHTGLSLTEIAHQSNFADQSHFIKTFRKLGGMTPGMYQMQKSLLPGHIFENVR